MFKTTPPGCQHLAGLCHAVLYAAITRRLQDAVLDVGFDTLDRGAGRLNRRLGPDDIRLGATDCCLSCSYLGFGQTERRFGALKSRLILIQLLNRSRATAREFLGTRYLLLRRAELRPALSDRSLRGILFGLALRNLTVGDLYTDDRPLQLSLGFAKLRLQHGRIHPGQHLPGANEVAFVEMDFLDPTSGLRSNVDFHRFNPAVACGNPLGQSRRLKRLPGPSDNADDDASNHEPQEPSPVLICHCPPVFPSNFNPTRFGAVTVAKKNDHTAINTSSLRVGRGATPSLGRLSMFHMGSEMLSP